MQPYHRGGGHRGGGLRAAPDLLAHLFGGLDFRLAYSLVGLCWLVASVLADYWLYTDFEPSMAALSTILSVLRLDGIAKFLIRGNVPVGVAGVCIPKQPKY